MNSSTKKVRLKSIAKTYSGGTPSRAIERYFKGNIPWIKSGEVNQRKITSIEETISEEALQKSSAKMVGINTILIAMYGATAGKVAITMREAAINQAILAIKLETRDIDNLFLFYFFEFIMPSFVHSSAQGGQSNLSAELINSLEIPILKLKEQQKIAEILSTWDEAIEKLERLIELKEQCFNLVTNKIISQRQNRKEKKLGEIFDVQISIEKGKGLTKASLHDGIVPVVAGGQNYAYYHNNSTHEAETITISASGAYAGYVWYHDYPIWASDCTVIHNPKNISLKFLYHFLKSHQKQIYQLQTGGAQPHIYANDLKNITIQLPKLNEQEKIVRFLDNLEQELSLHKQSLQAFQQQKQGLMQKLLTGKVRVKV